MNISIANASGVAGEGNIGLVVAYGRSTDPRHLYSCASNPEAQKFTNPGAEWSRPRQGIMAWEIWTTE